MAVLLLMMALLSAHVENQMLHSSRIVFQDFVGSEFGDRDMGSDSESAVSFS